MKKLRLLSPVFCGAVFFVAPLHAQDSLMNSSRERFAQSSETNEVAEERLIANNKPSGLTDLFSAVVSSASSMVDDMRESLAPNIKDTDTLAKLNMLRECFDKMPDAQKKAIEELQSYVKANRTVLSGLFGADGMFTFSDVDRIHSQILGQIEQKISSEIAKRKLRIVRRIAARYVSRNVRPQAYAQVGKQMSELRATLSEMNVGHQSNLAHDTTPIARLETLATIMEGLQSQIQNLERRFGSIQDFIHACGAKNGVQLVIDLPSGLPYAFLAGDFDKLSFAATTTSVPKPGCNEHLKVGFNYTVRSFKQADGSIVYYPVVASTVPGSPAERMGYKNGDLISNLAGIVVGEKGSSADVVAAMTEALNGLNPRASFAVAGYRRDGNSYSELSSREYAGNNDCDQDSITITVKTTKPPLGITYVIKPYATEKGQVYYPTITHVTPGSPAALNGMQVGDVIFSINGEIVGNKTFHPKIFKTEEKLVKSAITGNLKGGEEVDFVMYRRGYGQWQKMEKNQVQLTSSF